MFDDLLDFDHRTGEVYMIVEDMPPESLESEFVKTIDFKERTWKS